MPAISLANLNLLRTTQHKTLLHLAVYQPATIWYTQVNGAQTQGDTTITVDVPTVVRAPAKNYQVMFSAIGYGLNDLGEARWKSYSAPTLTVGAHNVPLANDTYITVKEEIKPLAIHATLNATDVVFEDGSTAYTAGATGENLQYHPLARMGPPACAFIDPATGLATLNFYSSSVAIASGATLSMAGWVFPSGTPGTSATPGTAGAPVTVTWNAAGQYYVALTVTDSNGKTHTTYRPVFIYDSVTLPYSQVTVESLKGDTASGVWRASLKVWGAATEAEFPDNAQVVLFAEDWFGDTKTSIGGEYTYRENIVWVGYVRGGSVKKNADYGYVEFDAESVSGVMKNLEGLAATLTSTTGTPAGWHVLRDMTYNLAAFHVLTEHSTISQIADCSLSLLSFTRSMLDLPESSVFDQLQFNISTPTRGQCGCSAQGMFYLEENPQLIPLADRTHPNVFANSPAPDGAAMALADFRDELDFGRDMHDKVTAQVDFAAENTAAAAIYSLAPAVPWASGRGERISGIRADSQADSNIFAGLYEGYRNNPYADVVLPLRGNYRICDTFPPEQVQITLTAAQNKRGFAWANQRCWIKSVSYEYRTAGILLASLVVEKDSYGYAGITGNYPTTPPEWPPPIFPPIEPPIEPPDIIPGDYVGKGNLLYVSTHTGLAKCEGAYGTNGTDGAPVWSSMNGSGGGALGNVVIRWFNLDPFSVSGDHFTAGWAMCDDGAGNSGLYRVTGLPTTPVWTSQLTLAQAKTLTGESSASAFLAYRFSPTQLTAGYITAFLCTPNVAGTYGRCYPLISTNYGTTWSSDTTHYPYGFPVNNLLRVDSSAHVSGRMFAHGGLMGFRGESIDGEIYNAGHLIGALYLKDAPNHYYGFETYQGNTGSGANLYLPYCDSAGAVYPDDNVGYTYGADHIGTGAVRRYTTFETPLWRFAVVNDYRAYTSIGDAAMPVLDWLFTNMFNEDYGVAIDANDIWLSSNLSQASPTWTRKNVPSIGGRVLTPTYHFCVPVDPDIVFFTGKHPSGGAAGYGLPCFTYDFGTNFVDISKPGAADGIDTVMGLSSIIDLNDSTIIVDYFKP